MSRRAPFAPLAGPAAVKHFAVWLLAVWLLAVGCGGNDVLLAGGASERRPEVSAPAHVPTEATSERVRLATPPPRTALRGASTAAQPEEARLVVRCAAQRLDVVRGDRVVRTYPVSTSSYGTGNRAGSNRTPLGRHRIAEKIGAGAPLAAVFRSRVATGEIARVHTDGTDTDEDLVLTRILWLEGREDGVNRGPGIDSKARFIYIHGTGEEGLIGRPASHGCVRMRNRDVVELFDSVDVGTEVDILP